MPRKLMVSRRLPDGSMSPEREEEWPTEAEIYVGKERLAIIDALNVLGCWSSLEEYVPKEHHEAIAGLDYELGEAYLTLYGALGIELDLRHPEAAYDEYLKLRDAEWAKERESE